MRSQAVDLKEKQPSHEKRTKTGVIRQRLGHGHLHEQRGDNLPPSRLVSGSAKCRRRHATHHHHRTCSQSAKMLKWTTWDQQVMRCARRAA